jgi:hypothetical protein
LPTKKQKKKRKKERKKGKTIKQTWEATHLMKRREERSEQQMNLA